ncbi:MAG: helix-turn-helix domain-containing protein [Rhodoplanes sp.]
MSWSQQDLAKNAGVGVVTVHQLEAGVSQPRRSTIGVVRRAFEAAGVEFIDENGGGPGVRLRKPPSDADVGVAPRTGMASRARR